MSAAIVGPVSQRLSDALEMAAPGAVTTRSIDRLAMSHDASPIMMVPQAVVRPRTADQVARLLLFSSQLGVPLTFRSGGTSLLGQGGTDGVLVDTRRHFRGIEVLDEGARVRVGPGVTVRAVNSALARHGRKLGPDPASEIACTVGGVIANNSSGMSCGTEFNTYRTIESAMLVLPSGTVLHTARRDGDEFLRDREPDLYAGLLRLRDRVRSNPTSVATIERLFALKNTLGYGVNAFLDHDDPVALLLHLVVGSEGTLAFVAEATFATVPAHPQVATGLVVYDSLPDASAALPALIDSGLAAIELMDARSLTFAQQDARAPNMIADLAVSTQAALLIEHAQPTPSALAEKVAGTTEVLASQGRSLDLVSDPRARAALWQVRKGLYTQVASGRAPGTTAIVEDVAVPATRLVDTCDGLNRLFDRHDYRDGQIFGHAKDGNLHFVISERFDTKQDRARFEGFIEDMVDLVLDQGGTLKAEHGTGRIMAPYLARQYGDELADVMRELKHLVDPAGLLNPGVIVADEPRAYLDHLTVSQPVEPEVDRCVACGFCEPACPSSDLTTTPRQRIALRRDMVAAQRAGDRALASELDADYSYAAVETCAVDGMCATACPLDINTADLTRRLRAEAQNRVTQQSWETAAKHWQALTRSAATALTVAKTAPPLSGAMTRWARRVLPSEVMPQWSPDLGPGGAVRRPIQVSDPVAVYLPSCTSTIFGTGDGDGVQAAFLRLCAAAGVAVRVPDQVAGLCCGTPWKSKGLSAGLEVMKGRVNDALWRASEQGRLPIVMDAASCTEGLTQLVAGTPQLTVVDAVAFVDEHVRQKLRVPEPLDRLVLHPTCASTQLGLNAALHRLAELVAGEVVVPQAWRCCAFAGDRGLLHPELTASATRLEALEVEILDAAHMSSAHASVNRTCEIGMTRATHRPYRHILEVLAEVAVPMTRQGGPR